MIVISKFQNKSWVLFMGISNLPDNFDYRIGSRIVSSILELRIVKIVISKFQNKSWDTQLRGGRTACLFSPFLTATIA